MSSVLEGCDLTSSTWSDLSVHELGLRSTYSDTLTLRCYIVVVGRYVDVDLTAVQTELTKAYDAATDIITDGIKGKATVHEEDVASLPNLVVPSDYMYCDKSWYEV